MRHKPALNHKCVPAEKVVAKHTIKQGNVDHVFLDTLIAQGQKIKDSAEVVELFKVAFETAKIFCLQHPFNEPCSSPIQHFVGVRLGAAFEFGRHANHICPGLHSGLLHLTRDELPIELDGQVTTSLRAGNKKANDHGDCNT